MEFLKRPRLNIQLFATPGESEGGGGEPTPPQDPNPPEPSPTPAPAPIAEPTPQEWQINHGDYEGLGEETVSTYIEHAKKNGWTEEYTKNTLTGRALYLSGEREKMTPDMRAYDTNISNFLTGINDAEERGVYERLAENAAGRKILVEKIIGGKETPGSNNLMGGGTATWSHDEFIEKYNDAKNIADKKLDRTKLKELENYARNSQDSFFREFLGL